MTEIWRMVSGFEGCYEISNLGRIRSVSRWVACRSGKRLIDGMILTPSCSGDYLHIPLSDSGRGDDRLIHRMVAEAFVPGVGPIVRHLDGDNKNNAATNLAWGTYKDNEADKDRHGRLHRGTKSHRSILSEGQVKQIRVLSGRGFSQLSIAKTMKLNRGVVGCVVRGETYQDVN